VRHSYPKEDYVVTTYGSHDAADHAKGISLLVKHKRRGKASWDVVLNGKDMRRGEASRVLQKECETGEATELYFAVEGVRLAFEGDARNAIAFYFKAGTEFSDGKDVFNLLDYFTGRKNIPLNTLQIMKDVLQAIQKENPGMLHPSPIHDTILRAIQTGDTRGIHLLAKCIEAVNKTIPKDSKDCVTYFLTRGTKRQKVADAVCAAANKLGRIPTWKEALKEFVDAGGDEEISTRADEGNFIRTLRDAGFGWILPRGKL
jgi:hypothetical protein